MEMKQSPVAGQDQLTSELDDVRSASEPSSAIDPGSPVLDYMYQFYLQSLVFALGVVVHLMEYLTTPGVIFTHVIGGGLLYALSRRGAHRVELVQAAVLEETVSYVLWTQTDSGLGTILALYCCVYLYEIILGPKVTARDNAQLIADDDVTSALAERCPGLTFDVIKDAARGFLVSTGLQYIVYSRREWRGDQGNYSQGIPISEISSIHSGYDLDISRAVRALGATRRTSFFVMLDDAPKTTVTFAARDVETRDLWEQALQELCGTTIGDIKALWLERACKAAGIDQLSSEVQLEQLGSVLEAAKRNAEKPYLTEILKSQSKLESKSSSNGISSKSDVISKLFDTVTFRPEVEIIYQRILQTDKERQKVLKPKPFCQFLRKEQREGATEVSTARDLIRQHETVLPSFHMSLVGFTNYMLSEDNSIFNREHRKVYQNMSHPLPHYFINTSHNTYLTKDQLKSKSSVDMYIQALKRGCKCVELDTWDGPNNEPVIYHGHTLTSKILFKDVITAVRDYAFVVSDYPVVLSFENHCSVEQQRVIASHLVGILQDKLYTAPIPDDERQFPSPKDLKGYVLVKYKKLVGGQEAYDSDSDSEDELTEEDIRRVQEADNDSMISVDEIAARKASAKSLGEVVKQLKAKKADKKKNNVPKIAQELSDLVIYCQSIRFKGFDYAKENSQYYEMSSLGEKKAMKFVKEDPCNFLAYNQRQLTRTYPAGGRIDSSNYDPQQLWNVGCQMVALNFQTADRPMQLNQGLFQENGGCGYVLKPHCMRIDNPTFDPRGPFEESKKLTVQIISGHQLPYTNEKQLRSERGFQVQIRVFGVEADVTKDKTKVIKNNNGYHVIWNEALTFRIHVADLTLVQLVVRDSGDSFLGQYTLPLTSMQQGYRNVPLYTKATQLIPYSSLFVHTQLDDQ